MKRDLETSRLVCADFSTFLRLVLNVVVHFPEGEQETNANVKGAEAQALVRALSAGKLEKLDWSEERWRQEMGFRHIESGPLVRSSYHAHEQVQKAGA